MGEAVGTRGEPSGSAAPSSASGGVDAVDAVDAVDGVDGPAMRAWARVALDALGQARAEIDGLNVFPVADGDTGTNLFLTLQAGCIALEALPVDADLAATVRTLARASLVGARGNSGIILSQLFRGIAGTLADEAARETESANADLLAEALRSATDSAYAAVVTPVEGTMLSVARGAAESAAAEPQREVVPVVLAAAAGARSALARTPQQLDALARAGVVDAGGRGVVVLLDALVAVVTRTPVPPPGPTHEVPGAPGQDQAHQHGAGAYEVMFLLDAEDADVPDLRGGLARLGDSVVLVGGDGLWNVHLHTDDAGAAVELAMQVGRPHGLRITALAAAPTTARRVAVLDTGAAPGLLTLLVEAGALPLPAEQVATGLEDVLLTLERGAAPSELVLLCTSDQVPRLDQAVRSARRAGVRAAVVPLRSLLQAVAAVAVHDPARGFEDDVVAMTAAAGHLRWAEVDTVSAAVRVDGESAAAAYPDGTSALLATLERMLGAGGELVTLLAGGAVPDGLVDDVRSALLASHPGVELAVHRTHEQTPLLLVGVE